MSEVNGSDRGNFKSETRPQAYAPGWVDRFTAWVERLPGPTWSYYIGLGPALLLLQIIVLWIEGAYSTSAFLPSYGFMAGAIAYQLALFRYLDNAADTALSTFRPALKASQAERTALRYQLTTLPARPTLLASLAGPTVIFLLEELRGRPASFEALATSPISAAVLYFIYLIGFSIFSALIYHTIHQLSVINRIYTRHTRIDLFRIRPLYAFSSVTALTAVSLTVITYGWNATNPELRSDPISIGILLLITVLAVATFAWPFLGIHRLLVEEKDRLLDESSLKLKGAIVEVHRRMDSGELEAMSGLNMAIASLEMEQKALEGIPTWPWRPETVRLLVTALGLPLGLWIAQYVLQRILGP